MEEYSYTYTYSITYAYTERRFGFFWFIFYQFGFIKNQKKAIWFILLFFKRKNGLYRIDVGARTATALEIYRAKGGMKAATVAKKMGMSRPIPVSFLRVSRLILCKNLLSKSSISSKMANSTNKRKFFYKIEKKSIAFLWFKYYILWYRNKIL